MLNWLMKILGGGQPQMRKLLDLEARLVAGDPASMLHGDGEYEAWEDGSWSFEVEVEGHDGSPAPQGLVAFIDGVEVGSLTPRGDEAELKLSHRAGDTLAAFPDAGSTLEVKGPAGEHLSGAFHHDR